MAKDKLENLLSFKDFQEVPKFNKTTKHTEIGGDVVNENVYMNMSFFELKGNKHNPVVITNYNGISLNGDIKKFKNIIDIIFDNKDNLSNKTIYENRIPKGDLINIKNIKFEMDSYDKNRSENVVELLNFIEEKFGIVDSKYSPHGMTPFMNVEIERNFDIMFK